jgi:hypothetical protein
MVMMVVFPFLLLPLFVVSGSGSGDGQVVLAHPALGVPIGVVLKPQKGDDYKKLFHN